MKLAYFGIPHMGGTYTVYRSLRDGLRPHGHTVAWLGAGPAQARAVDAAARDPDFAADIGNGTVVAPDETEDTRQAGALAEHLARNRFDGVVANVLADRVQTNLVRYLDPRLLRVMIVHSITPGTYRAASAVRTHVHATVGVSPRIVNDLCRNHRFARERMSVICNAVAMPPHDDAQRAPRGPQVPLRLLFLGRLEEASKGIFLLPRIMAVLSGASATLTVAGGGPDETALWAQCAALGDRVRFLGAVPHAEVRHLMAEHDVLLFPSHFEGFGQALIEAMAVGCVPVASRITGVTTHIIADGITGFLHPIGDAATAAAAVRRLDRDRVLLARVSRAAIDSARERFSPAVMANAYAALLDTLRRDPPSVAEPLPLSDWRLPRGLRPGLRTYLPAPAKTLGRRMIERLATIRGVEA